MNEEDQLQREWRSIVINRLDSLNTEIKNLQSSLLVALTSVQEIHSVKTRLDELAAQFTKDKESTDKANKELFVSKDAFEPVKILTYGAAGVILLAVVGALVALVLAVRKN